MTLLLDVECLGNSKFYFIYLFYMCCVDWFEVHCHVLIERFVAYGRSVSQSPVVDDVCVDRLTMMIRSSTNAKRQ
ncbi:conserved hypothetical protein [Trichinella spiralis]|uniref:hypothetical protein n=1 Tax=Trichinella spiralis TaxID=6334 RepID=UPI0001EFE025|nr:conserved hypothetical protein [Trichinella spiralis]